jgi:hypothetical protein
MRAVFLCILFTACGFPPPMPTSDLGPKHDGFVVRNQGSSDKNFSMLRTPGSKSALPYSARAR